MPENLRDEAKKKLDEAYELLKKAGIPERLPDLTEEVVEWKDLEHMKDEHGCEYIQFLSCAICGPDDHNLELVVRKDTSHHWQYTLELVLKYSYHDWGFWQKVKEVFRTIQRLFWHKRMEEGILLNGDDLTKFKDVMKRLGE